MGKNIVEKILEEHLVEGTVKEGEEVYISIDQVLTQDATGTMAYLQFEAMGLDKIQIPLAVSYVDHNTLQIDNKNPDDHIYLQTVAARYGAYFSRPGNGICHQVHLERFARPGATLLGSDSHTPTAGGIGSLAIGVGGLEIASAMGGEPFAIKIPKMVRVWLEGELQRPYLMAMDIILELLRRLSVKGGVGKIFEYDGPGVKTLTVTERATITNMGAELGATTSIFPSDEITLRYMKAQKREDQWRELKADKDSNYSEEIKINLSELEPLIARPHQPDNVVKIREIAGIKVNQVNVGSCTNSSYQALKSVTAFLRGKTVHPSVSMTVSPGSKQVYEMMAREGDLADLIASGVRVLESVCGPCIGMGQAPPSKGVSVRSFNRNFKGRSGTVDAEIYLASPVSCAAIALKGELVDPRDVGIKIPIFQEPEEFTINDNMIIPPLPPEEAKNVKVIKGPNIKDVPVKEPLSDRITITVLLKVGDNITTDDIMPAGAEILPLRSNIPEISKYVFWRIEKEFYRKAKEAGTSVVIGGENYGQGSSREHAALAPMYLGLRAVLAKSFARIHRSNLINFGIFPLTFLNPADYEKIEEGDILEIVDIYNSLENDKTFKVINKSKNYTFEATARFTRKEKEVLKAGGLLPYIRRKRGSSV
ncbi:MAG: aconitate hydratase [Candidatus Aminicenantia bacterium]